MHPASIPSPTSGSLHLGPVTLNAYGLMIALGVIAAVWLAGRRLEQRNVGTTDDIASIATWAVPAGVIGARLYHVVTDWERFSGHLADTVKIWQGGLGIWGGITLGVIVGVWRASVRGLRIGDAVNCVAPALALAQSIGRWGNWFNQELFGRPTELPWALRVSARTARDAGYPAGTTFHPTFLYESLWCLALCLLLVVIDRRFRIRPGRLFLFYVAGYTAVRFFIEGLRVDEAHTIAGWRLNQWTSVALFAIAVAILSVDGWRHRGESVGAPDDSTPGGSGPDGVAP